MATSRIPQDDHVGRAQAALNRFKVNGTTDIGADAEGAHALLQIIHAQAKMMEMAFVASEENGEINPRLCEQASRGVAFLAAHALFCLERPHADPLQPREA